MSHSPRGESIRFLKKQIIFGELNSFFFFFFFSSTRTVQTVIINVLGRLSIRFWILAAGMCSHSAPSEMTEVTDGCCAMSQILVSAPVYPKGAWWGWGQHTLMASKALPHQSFLCFPWFLWSSGTTLLPWIALATNRTYSLYRLI